MGAMPVQIVVSVTLLTQLQQIFRASDLMAVPLPQEVVGDDDLKTYVVWPRAQAEAAGFTYENTVAFGRSERSPTERSNTHG